MRSRNHQRASSLCLVHRSNLCLPKRVTGCSFWDTNKDAMGMLLLGVSPGSIDRMTKINLARLSSFAFLLFILLFRQAAFAASKPAGFDRFFVFCDSSNLSAKEMQGITDNFKVGHLDKWSASEKLQVKKVVDYLAEHNPGEIERISRGEKIRFFRTHDSMSHTKNQNSPSAAPPNMRTVFHELLISDSYFEATADQSDAECRKSVAHELGHIADVEDSLSLSPAWLTLELPKLIEFKRQLESQKQAKKKLSDEDIAKKCALPSAYAGRHPTEDFAENYAQLLCDKKELLKVRHAIVRKLLDSVSPAMQEAFHDAILADQNL